MAALRRVNGKLTGVNPAVSCCRLRQVQTLLCDGGSSGPDGLLCSLGIDSRYNAGCTELARFLFYGLYERQQVSLEPQLDEFPEETLDDVILLIKAECVHLYCNPLNWSYLLPFVSHWRNLHLYCMTEAEYEDEEAAEEFKISSFVTMVQDCRHIGVPNSAQGHVQRFDVFMVEKWPLIQAFALDGIGGGSFFTLKYQLTDMSEKLWQVYNRLDPVSLERLLTEELVNFEKQWNSFFSSMELESHLSILELSEAQAGEPFRSYYSHGLISSNITEKSRSQQPFVLFGKHSSLEDLENYSFSFPSESHQVRNTGCPGSSATHMIVQSVAPKGPLACARTYFFGTTHTPFLGNQTTQPQKSHVLLLSQIYRAAVQGVLSGIGSYSSTGSAAKAKEAAESSFLLALDSMDLSRYCGVLRSRCEFSIEAVNNQRMSIPLTDERSRYVVKTASLMVHDVPDLQDGSGLGSVVFSDSFLESSINILQRDGAVSSDSCYTVLTATVPPYACWLMESDVKQSEQAQLLAKKEDSSCLGSVLTTSDSSYLFSSSFLSTPEEGKLVFFSEGLLFVHTQFGSITLSQHHISSIKFYQPDSDTVACLFVEYESVLLPHLPFSLHSSDRCLLFALQPGSNILRTFYSQVLSVWKSPDSGLNLQMLEREQLSGTQRNMQSRLQKLHDGQEPPVAKRRGSLKASHSQLPEQDMFLQHFALSSIGPEPILSDHLGVLFPSAELKNNSSALGDKVVISIVTGLPGSHKERLCRFLLEPSQDRGRWVLYEPGPDGFSASRLHHFLSGFLQSQRGTRGKPRLLLFSPGYTDVVDVIQAVLFHPDPVLRACFTIGAVTACVDPLSSCMEHRFTFPKLLEQISQGVVSTVVLTGPTAEKNHPVVQFVQQLLRSANPTAAVIQAERGSVSRDEDVDLILSESSFSEPQMLRARYVLYPGWCRGRFRCDSGTLVLQQLCVPFGRALERNLFVSRCKAVKSSLRPSPFRGNLYNVWGRVRFSDSEQPMEVSYNAVSGSLTVVPDPRAHDPDCFLTFDGVGLNEDGLKDWLRLCVQQKQTKKDKKSRNSLSPQEIKTVHAERHLEPLPPGFFFNGSQFLNIFGEKTLFHPHMEDFLDEYVNEANEEIERFNAQLELQGQPDLFDP